MYIATYILRNQNLNPDYHIASKFCMAYLKNQNSKPTHFQKRIENTSPNSISLGFEGRELLQGKSNQNY